MSDVDVEGPVRLEVVLDQTANVQLVVDDQYLGTSHGLLSFFDTIDSACPASLILHAPGPWATAQARQAGCYTRESSRQNEHEKFSSRKSDESVTNLDERMRTF